jgi:hypothetical protein
LRGGCHHDSTPNEFVCWWLCFDVCFDVFNGEKRLDTKEGVEAAIKRFTSGKLHNTIEWTLGVIKVFADAAEIPLLTLADMDRVLLYNPGRDTEDAKELLDMLSKGLYMEMIVKLVE